MTVGADTAGRREAATEQGTRDHERAGAAAMESRRHTLSAALRVAIIGLGVVAGFGAVAAQLVNLAIKGQAGVRVSVTAPISESYSRPPILDRDGRLLAMDLLLPSITANPSKIPDVRETIARLSPLLSPADAKRLKINLANRNRDFIWVARKVSTAAAQRIHNLGLPGVGQRVETKRAYPQLKLAGHVLGAVNVSNAGTHGLEAHLDRVRGLRMARPTDGADRPPLVTTLSTAVQFAVEDELAKAMAAHRASGASAIVMDPHTGAVAAAASLPRVDPAFPETWATDGPIDRVSAGVYELGSIFKAVTIAMGLDHGVIAPHSRIDVNTPIEIGRTTFKEKRRYRAPLTPSDIFVASSNVGSGKVALAVGAEKQRAFLARLGLLGPMRTEAGAITPPVLPKHWGPVETVTISFGHGLAVAPLQFAAAGAALVNGGFRVRPTFVAGGREPDVARTRVISERTSTLVREMMRANVVRGTGQAADIAGYNVGGKTGTADQAEGKRGYDGKSVITSFFGAFPIDRPRYVVLVTLYDPKSDGATGRGRRDAATNAVPLAGRMIARIAPLLGVLPDNGTP